MADSKQYPSCDLDYEGGQACEATFNELKEAMQKPIYWVKFFMRPCCPAPGMHQANYMIDKLKSEVDARGDFNIQEQTELKQLIDGGLEWYKKTGVRKSA
ncbi:MAG: hypothetical protein MJ189_01640 [Coriobacteriales bacterium]|nr:hypothetical protein [Coriobacteriales bacterium]